VDALVNTGLLAQRLGRADEALDDWRRAVDLDATQANAQLYLGDALSARGQDQAAARHYRTYLLIVAARPQEHTDASSQVIAALVKVADADARLRHVKEAADGYEMAAQLAEKEGNAAMQSLAYVRLAELEEGQGRAGGAATYYQRALALDAAVTDPLAVATDWAEYGQFLQRAGQPERFAYACFLRAEELLRDAPGETQKAVMQLRQESEARLGTGEAWHVRKRRGALLQQALKVELPARPGS
jgi:tetratricopeptide (TPR) repeat protein